MSEAPVREARIVQHSTGEWWSVRVRERPAWFPWWTFSRWRTVKDRCRGDRCAWALEDARKIRDQALANGTIPGVYDSDCHVIVE